MFWGGSLGVPGDLRSPKRVWGYFGRIWGRSEGFGEALWSPREIRGLWKGSQGGRGGFGVFRGQSWGDLGSPKKLSEEILGIFGEDLGDVRRALGGSLGSQGDRRSEGGGFRRSGGRSGGLSVGQGSDRQLHQGW